MKNKTYLIVKTALFLLSFYLVFKFVGSKEYDCQIKCSLSDAGRMLAIFLMLSLAMMFYEKARAKILELLKLFIPAFFILYSSVYYIDSIQHEQEISSKKDFIDLQIKYIELLDKNVTHKEVFADLTENLNTFNVPFDKYVNKTLYQYKDTIGRAMMGLTIGMFVILILEVLACVFNKRKDDI